MRILVDINHPHHVHLFRNAIRIWRSRGHEVLITARVKDITTDLLDLYNLKYQLTSKKPKENTSSMLGVLALDWNVLRAARDFNPDWLIGTSFAIAHVSKFVKGRSIVFGEDSLAASRWFWKITIPFADFIITPSTIKDNLGKNHVTYEGYQELAYLHPDVFEPDKDVLTGLNIQGNRPIFLMRFVSLQASHDKGQKGLSIYAKRRLVNLLSKQGQLFISAEGQIDPEFAQYRLQIRPDKIHDLMSFADLLISDSQSMTIEAAVLGIPSVRCNTFVDRTPVIKELEDRYGLTDSFLPTQEGELLKRVEGIPATRDRLTLWQARRRQMLSEKINLTQWMVDLPEKL